jgi:hypothetical protein
MACCSWWSMPPARSRISPISRPACRQRSPSARGSPGPGRASGAAGSRDSAKPLRRCGRHAVHERKDDKFDGCPAMSRARAIPARTALRSPSISGMSRMLWDMLCADPLVKPIGLGARDSLRLEAGLCLYGHDIDTTTSPVEGALVWSMQKRRREEGGFPGAARIQRNWRTARPGPCRHPAGGAPARPRRHRNPGWRPPKIGVVTSGGFGPTLNGPLAMGYVEAGLCRCRHRGDSLIVRDKAAGGARGAMPFVPNRYFRSK